MSTTPSDRPSDRSSDIDGRTREIAIIGAGAVGAVYGRHLQRGGARVTFVVRPRQRADVKAGIRLYRGRHEETLIPDDVIDAIDALAGRALDEVWICTPSTGLDEDDLEALAAATDDATLVDLMPDPERRVRRIAGDERTVEGVIPFIAYQTPLPNVPEEAHRAPGIAYVLLPFTPTPFAGPRARSCADALAAGGMSARVVDDLGVTRPVGEAWFSALVAHLEAAGWDLKRACRSFDRALLEAVDVAAKEAGGSKGPMAVLAHPAVTRALLTLAPHLLPLPVEAYLKFHFTKVGPQMHASLDALVALADKHGVAAPHLRALQANRPAVKADGHGAHAGHPV